MKVQERKPVPKSQYGRIVFNNHDLMPHEIETIFCLSSFGFDVETIIPSNTLGSNNPDLLMLGTFWEMKGPTSGNEKTIKKRFRKAIKQAGGRGVFDLRRINDSKEREEALETIISLFKNSREMRRIMAIMSETCLIDILK